MKRVLVAAMAHESNSFNPIIAGEKDFQVLRGEDVIRRRAANDALTGILNTLEAAGYTPVPTLFVSAVPNGLVDRQFYDRVRKDILEIARQEPEKAPRQDGDRIIPSTRLPRAAGCCYANMQ